MITSLTVAEVVCTTDVPADFSDHLSVKSIIERKFLEYLLKFARHQILMI